jgi:uncharacterized membrane protein
MGFSGYTARDTLIILTVAVGVFLILQFIVINQIALAILILVGLIIPIALVTFEYRKNFREFQCNNCKHNFTVSRLRLLFTTKFSGTDPVPTGTAAYDLKCPKCNKRDWLVPSG